MSQIIKITESQLKNIVGRVLNKQLGLSPATTNNNATSVLNEADFKLDELMVTSIIFPLIVSEIIPIILLF